MCPLATPLNLLDWMEPSEYDGRPGASNHRRKRLAAEPPFGAGYRNARNQGGEPIGFFSADYRRPTATRRRFARPYRQDAAATPRKNWRRIPECPDLREGRMVQ